MALDRYEARAGAYRVKALKAPTAYEVARQLLHGVVNLHGDRNNPAGCMGVQSALVCGDDSAAIRREVASRRRAGEAAIRRRLQRAKAEGDLLPKSDAAGLARFLSVLIYGMAVQSAGGASRRELLKVAEIALNQWPDNSWFRSLSGSLQSAIWENGMSASLIGGFGSSASLSTAAVSLVVLYGIGT
jgi:tetracycline repressor-like protein